MLKFKRVIHVSSFETTHNSFHRETEGFFSCNNTAMTCQYELYMFEIYKILYQTSQTKISLLWEYCFCFKVLFIDLQ